MTVNRIIKIIRIANGINQKELAARLEVSPSYLCELENGKREFSLRLFKKTCAELNVKGSEVMSLVEWAEENNVESATGVEVLNKFFELKRKK